MTEQALPPQVRMAEYVLGLLDPPDSAALERNLRGDSALRGDYHFWITRLATLNTAYAPMQNPVSYRTVADRLFGRQPARALPLWVKLAGVLAAAVIIAIKIEVIIMILRYLVR